jgi:hypothetical protein
MIQAIAPIVMVVSFPTWSSAAIRFAARILLVLYANPVHAWTTTRLDRVDRCRGWHRSFTPSGCDGTSRWSGAVVGWIERFDRLACDGANVPCFYVHLRHRLEIDLPSRFCPSQLDDCWTTVVHQPVVGVVQPLLIFFAVVLPFGPVLGVFALKHPPGPDPVRLRSQSRGRPNWWRAGRLRRSSDDWTWAGLNLRPGRPTSGVGSSRTCVLVGTGPGWCAHRVVGDSPRSAL